MALSEELAITDLRLRMALVLGVLIVGLSMVTGVWLFGEDTAITLGVAVGALLLVVAGATILRRLR